MNIIITGGCGFVGSALSIFLKKNLKNSKILSIDNLSKSYSKFNQAILSKNKIKNEKINLGNPNSLNKIKFKADYIIDCSAEPAVEASKKKIVKVEPIKEKGFSEFQEKEFLKGAELAYESIITAFAKGDQNKLKDLLTAEMNSSFGDAIEQRNKNKIITVQELYDFVFKKVRNYTGNAQSPTLTGVYDSRMPVSVIR